jgi:hypothetical protein
MQGVDSSILKTFLIDPKGLTCLNIMLQASRPLGSEYKPELIYLLD